MAKPIGIAKATKDNSRKLPHNREEWMEAKKIGRPKQVWVWIIEPCDDGTSKYNGPGIGHWTEVAHVTV